MVWEVYRRVAVTSHLVKKLCVLSCGAIVHVTSLWQPRHGAPAALWPQLAVQSSAWPVCPCTAADGELTRSLCSVPGRGRRRRRSGHRRRRQLGGRKRLRQLRPGGRRRGAGAAPQTTRVGQQSPHHLSRLSASPPPPPPPPAPDTAVALSVCPAPSLSLLQVTFSSPRISLATSPAPPQITAS